MMSKILLFMLFLVSFSSLVKAEDIFSAEDKKSLQHWLNNENGLNESLNGNDIELLSGREKKSHLVKISEETSFISESPAVMVPNCQDKKLRAGVLARIAKYYDENKEKSIIDQRKETLLLKNLQAFEEVDLSKFSPKENYAVSDKLIEYKINKGIRQEDMILCRSKNEKQIYLLIYPRNNFYTVEILNFSASSQDSELSFVYN